ncbi:uncharacterized protein B0H64DRAFT_392114 [Chaetomium fimeti]|uniref:Fungal N-terminal domain-containing protein n=1 Tax=Chaetomium fimeti TaxID=1854472 RepID=A0AAE0LTQ1_9PEZI|nr:hypothetical protein B0H64DRAFT_392114 [Chaetomium fimeti]
MADPLSVAGLAMGVVSLGIQVSQGITTYIDALNCRDQDLLSVRERNNSLRQTLQVVERSRSQLEDDHQVATAAIRECLDSCNKELGVLEDLVIYLTACDQSNTASLIGKVRNKSKKLLYPFSRPKLEQLETRLRNANAALQLALQILGLSVSHLGTEKLVTLEATSYGLSTSFHKTQSEISAMSLPLKGIQSSVSGFEARFGNMESLLQQLLAQQLAINGSPQEITPKVATGRLLAKPRVLKDICDAAGAQTSPTSGGMVQAIDHRATHSGDAISTYYTGGSLSCLCRHRRRVRTQNVVLGSLMFSSEAATEQHLPGCPAARVLIGTDRSQKVGVTYTGLRRLLNSAVQLSFEMTWGAGAWSLSPSFTYYPSVDAETAPAFKVLRLLSVSRVNSGLHDSALWEELAVSAVSVMLRLFRANKASPRAVDADNRSLVCHLADCMTMASDRSSPQFPSQGKPSALLELLRCLLDNKAPANQYDLFGNAPLSRLFLSTGYSRLTDPWIADAANLILRSNAEDNLACLSNPHPAAYVMIVNRLGRRVGARDIAAILYFLAFSTEIAKAYGCGPLSLAILSNNPKQVEQLLQDHPATLAERNLFGHTPLHLAADKPSCLQLLVKVADAELLNQEHVPGKFGMTALETALCLSGSHCREGLSGRMCQQCSCDDCVVVILEADCAVPVSSVLQSVLGWASERCKMQYIRGMRDRRCRLKQLALDNLSATEIKRLGLLCPDLLDSAASRVTQSLEDGGIRIPEALTPSKDGPRSLYQSLCSPEDADLFFDLGFHDTASWCNANAGELEDIPSLIQDLPYMYWLAAHGAGFRQLGSFPTPRDTFVGNYIFRRIGEDLNFWPGSFIFNRIRCGMPFKGPAPPDNDRFPPVDNCIAWVHEVNAAVLPAEIADSCRCKCSPGGCTPLTSLLKGVPGLIGYTFGHKRRRPSEPGVSENTDSMEGDSATEDTNSIEGSVAGDTESSDSLSWMRGSLSAVATYFTEYLEHFGGDLDVNHHTAALRYITFSALDIPHYCCGPNREVWGYDWRTPAEVEEEHAYELRLLDELLSEFEKQIMAILQGPIGGVDGVIRFWKRTWVNRMREVLAGLARDDLASDAKRAAEDIGVVWDKPKPPKPRDNPYRKDTLEHWMHELEKIEAEC